jgi:hypothetical protein
MPPPSTHIFADDGGLPAMDHRGGRAVSQFHPALGEAILERLAAGATVREVCADPAMPCPATLKRWRKMHPGFAGRYEAVMDQRAEDHRRHARLRRERRKEWIAIEVKTGRRKPQIMTGGGRRSTYDPAWARAFCARVARGEPVYRIVEDPQMPSRSQVYGWLRRQPAFEAMYGAAKDEAIAWLAFQADMVAEQALDGAMTAGRFAVIRSRVARIEGRIGLLRPKVYRALGAASEWLVAPLPPPRAGG